MRKKLAGQLDRRTRHLMHKYFLTIHELRTITGLSRATLYRRMAQDGFPQPALRRGRKYYWDVRDLMGWTSTFNGRLLFGKQQWDDTVARHELHDRIAASLPDEERMAFRRARTDEWVKASGRTRVRQIRV